MTSSLWCISVLGCRNLISMDTFGKNDVFVQVGCGSRAVQKTRVLQNAGSEAVFDPVEQFELYDIHTCQRCCRVRYSWPLRMKHVFYFQFKLFTDGNSIRCCLRWGRHNRWDYWFRKHCPHFSHPMVWINARECSIIQCWSSSPLHHREWGIR